MRKFTSAAELEFITFERFLDEVSTLEVVHTKDYMAQYTEQVAAFGGFSFGGRESSEGIVTFQKRYIELNRFINIDARKNQLALQLAHEDITYPENLLFTLEDLSILSATHYCEPKYAVNIDNRQWMVCDPNDFVILKSPTDIKSTLVCKHKYRNKIVHIGKR